MLNVHGIYVQPSVGVHIGLVWSANSLSPEGGIDAELLAGTAPSEVASLDLPHAPRWRIL